MKYASVIVGMLLAGVLLTSCDNLILAQPARIQFALVIDDMSLEGDVAYANVHEHSGDGALLATVHGAFVSITGSPTAVWCEMTTAEELPTNRRYFLDFWIDLDGSDSQTPGDLAGNQVFEVRPNEPYSEARSFSADLVTL